MASFTPQEIEQFLQEFFDVVGARQYVGARYVPIFGRAGEGTVEWDDTAPYEPLTVVMHDGVSYVSRRYVPAGIDIADTGYWVQTYRYNAQVEQYRQEVLTFQGQIDDRIPFPNPDFYPKYGTAGQVLETLTDGTVRWTDPVVPSDEQAEAVITEWLDAHPEATTTVLDGSVTDAKMSSGANQFYNTAIRATPATLTPTNTTVDQRDLNRLGSDLRNNSVIRFANFTTEEPLANAPSPTWGGVLLCMSLNGETGYGVQLAFTQNSPFTIYWRFYVPNTSASYPWHVISDGADQNVVPLADKVARAVLASGTNYTPSNIPTALRDLNNIGTGEFRNNTVYRFVNFTSSDHLDNAPYIAFNGIVICCSSASNNNFGVHIAFEEVAPFRMWYRYAIGTSASLTWKQVVDSRDMANAFLSAGYSYQPSNIPAVMRDLNNLGIGAFRNLSMYRFANFTAADHLDNAPYLGFRGFLVNYGTTADARFGLQIAVEEVNPFRIWYRYFVYDIVSTHSWHLFSQSQTHEVSTAAELFALLRLNPAGVINLAPGTYDLYTGLMGPLILDDTYRATFISNNVVINGNGSTINIDIPEAVARAHTAACNEVSAFDCRAGLVLNDITINCHNTRYCVHYESLAEPIAYEAEVRLSNCVLNYRREEISGLNASCLGFGGNKGQKLDLRNCKLTNGEHGGPAVYIHGRGFAIGHISVENCVFDTASGYGIGLSQYTGTTDPVDVVIATSRVGTVRFFTQSGGNTDSQYRARFINSDVTPVVESSTTLLYPYETINTMGA